VPSVGEAVQEGVYSPPTMAPMNHPCAPTASSFASLGGDGGHVNAEARGTCGETESKGVSGGVES
jgi:hypothetical protein